MLDVFDRFDASERLDVFDRLEVSERLDVFDRFDASERLDVFDRFDASERLDVFDRLDASERFDVFDLLDAVSASFVEGPVLTSYALACSTATVGACNAVGATLAGVGTSFVAAAPPRTGCFFRFFMTTTAATTPTTTTTATIPITNPDNDSDFDASVESKI